MLQAGKNFVAKNHAIQTAKFAKQHASVVNHQTVIRSLVSSDYGCQPCSGMLLH
jgi:hypothetical protein